ncbi:MAG TPA: hypothetical protein PLA41_02315 [Candidatus Pacearchaeota archaeon]|nr:hypothetical protein [Candidatus Parcubacteria bacterium]HNZ83775.1 hypothetical protein [Candidatus Pacearchaeota archaeon]HOU45960.1 hypothetical protein [Candidatus Pacearchaeota archaeon]HPM08754.1 hypothetical protein [Candidatus Pacearchaeota archaeon]HQI74641.1 hypothetical protein [Candidatus Pacearchaeota archaeon]
MIDKNHSKTEKLLADKWSDRYFCKLALLDHLRECLAKDNHLKAIDAAKTDKGYLNLDKELMDLKIILDFYFNDSKELYEKRLAKFIEKIK